MRKRILILGSTGSVGRNVLDVIGHHPDRFEVVGLAVNRNTDLALEQCRRHPGALMAVCRQDARERLIREHPAMAARSVTGTESLVSIIERCEPDLVVNALVGFVGLKPTLSALSLGIPVALANKEAVVTGGVLLREAARTAGAALIPIDSEHVAISQCLGDAAAADVTAVYITASGGALRDHPLDSLGEAAPEDVLDHPTWAMGDKITVDSATLVNKGLEIIEAHWLFGLPFDKIKVVVHPQSIVHSLVEFKDNSIIAQMGVPDMRLPILYALSYPERIGTPLARSRITEFPALSFREVDPARYPCLALAERAGREGGNAPAILNSANEVAVGAFLAKRVPFSHIHRMISAALDHVPRIEIRTFGDVEETDRRTRAYIEKTFDITSRS